MAKVKAKAKRKSKKAAEWKPGDPITEEQDRARRKYSPCFREDERDEYEHQLYKARLERGDDSTEKELHITARIETAYAAVNPEEADRARRLFSPEVQDDDREYYESRLRAERVAMGHVFTLEQTHFRARTDAQNMLSRRHQQRIGAEAEAKQQKQIRRSTRLGKSKLSEVPLMNFEVALAKHKDKRNWLRCVTDDLIAYKGETVSMEIVSAELRNRGIKE